MPAGIAGPYLAECESLRGIAILLVMAFHAHLQLAPTHALAPNLLSAFVIAGNTGVTLFFVLSGFLLNLPFQRRCPPSTATFFRNRALRILPMYVAVVVIGGIYHRDMASALRALLFWNVGIDTLRPFGTVWWSLMVEVQFYLLLPPLYWLGASARRRWLLFPVFCIGCILYLLYTNRLPWHPERFYFIASPKDSIVCLWPVFFLGGVLARVHGKYGDAIRQRAARSRLLAGGGADLLLLATVLALAAALLAVSRAGPFAARAFHFDHVLIEASCWALLIGALLYLPLRTKILWSNPILNFFGTISYSLYLLHSTIMHLGLRWISDGPPGALSLPKPLQIAVLLAIAIALATLTYTAIEKPALRLKQRTRPLRSTSLENPA